MQFGEAGGEQLGTPPRLPQRGADSNSGGGEEQCGENAQCKQAMTVPEQDGQENGKQNRTHHPEEHGGDSPQQHAPDAPDLFLRLDFQQLKPRAQQGN